MTIILLLLSSITECPACGSSMGSQNSQDMIC